MRRAGRLWISEVKKQAWIIRLTTRKVNPFFHSCTSYLSNGEVPHIVLDSGHPKSNRAKCSRLGKKLHSTGRVSNSRSETVWKQRAKQTPTPFTASSNLFIHSFISVIHSFTSSIWFHSMFHIIELWNSRLGHTKLNKTQSVSPRNCAFCRRERHANMSVNVRC